MLLALKTVNSDSHSSVVLTAKNMVFLLTKKLTDQNM